ELTVGDSRVAPTKSYVLGDVDIILRMAQRISTEFDTLPNHGYLTGRGVCVQMNGQLLLQWNNALMKSFVYCGFLQRNQPARQKASLRMCLRS
ncbi:MAG: hypothetical protein OXI30_06290, partial [Chloroflexota bacterium]|nr:hypothetical protein [Chloroflexota bacterium]